eukprot:TRINITY_DN1337_c0_g1_i5.p1 TRINITY_DN1337_c0_g1~~TRINITY_DN1337_c0_g1_i5.p1  ORF type:complete len:452 (+),score=65.79 TRINITY_DN1337_c0_g1_i5:67-1422(+)
MFRRLQRLRRERPEAVQSNFDGVFPAAGDRELVHPVRADQRLAANDRELARPAAYDRLLVHPDRADQQAAANDRELAQPAAYDRLVVRPDRAVQQPAANDRELARPAAYGRRLVRPDRADQQPAANDRELARPEAYGRRLIRPYRADQQPAANDRELARPAAYDRLPVRTDPADQQPAANDRDLARPAAHDRELVCPDGADQQPAPNDRELAGPAAQDRELARPTAHDRELVRPDPADRQRSITCEFLPGMYRPLRSEGSWTKWDPDRLASHLEQDLDDEPEMENYKPCENNVDNIFQSTEDLADQQQAADDRVLIRPASYDHSPAHPDPAGRSASITLEFRPGMYRPVRSDGPWVVWRPDLLPENVPFEQEDDDDEDGDELLLGFGEYDDWSDLPDIEDVATSRGSPLSSRDIESNSSKADSQISTGSKKSMQPDQVRMERHQMETPTDL